MGHVIGIDLGTTNTAVSVVVDGRPKMLEDSHGYKVVPSVVWVGDDRTIKVGQQCKSLLVTDPSRTAFAVKRLIGRLHGSPEAEDADPRVGYDIERADDGGCLVALESGTFTPVEISAHVLRTAKEMAERALGGTVDEAVITVPAVLQFCSANSDDGRGTSRRPPLRATAQRADCGGLGLRIS